GAKQGFARGGVHARRHADPVAELPEAVRRRAESQREIDRVVGGAGAGGGDDYAVVLLGLHAGISVPPLDSEGIDRIRPIMRCMKIVGTGGTPRVSFLIATHNRRNVLLNTLAHVHACGLASGDFEALVVDNASADATADALRTPCPPRR